MARISKEKQEEIRLKILEVSLEKFSTVGFENTSTKEIAKEVGIAEGTLFNYFDTKTEIFFEAFGDEYMQIVNNLSDIKTDDNITEILMDYFKKNLKMMLRIPRGVIGELMVASIRMAKKKPDRFKRLIELDFKFIGEIEVFIKRLQERGLLKEVDAGQLSEIIFGVIGYELIMYVYDIDIKKESMMNNMKTKLDIIIKGYQQGGSDD